MKFLLGVVSGLLLLAVGMAVIVFSGRINIGADHEHSPLVYGLLEKARISSIEHASRDIDVPKLDEAASISAGGADYKDMCASCHLSPGVEQTDLSMGLYPRPPNFTDANVASRFATDAGAKQGFWAIKHGIMASGMPAWGASHDDKRIWDMVAFIRELPELDSNQYAILTTRFDDVVMRDAFDSETAQ